MKLEHIAISVTDISEIGLFYEGILGMKKVRNFVLNKNLARDIFGIDKETKAFLLQKNELILEIFVVSESIEKGFNHICISDANREELVKIAMQYNYEVIRIEREYNDLIFIKDNSGNIFEMK